MVMRSHQSRATTALPLARQLAFLRKGQGLTQRQLAELTGIQQPEISRIEAGVSNPNASTLWKLAASLGYQLSLVPQEDHPSEPASPSDMLRDPVWHGRIWSIPGRRSGQPLIRGMRITVRDILEYLASGMTPEEVVADFPELELEDIRAALAYAAAQVEPMPA